MKYQKLALTTMAALISYSSFGVEVYFGEEREKSFACKVATSIKKSYSDKYLRDLRRGIKKILRNDINPYVDAHPIPAGFSLPKLVDIVIGLPGFPIDRSEYWLYMPFGIYTIFFTVDKINTVKN